MNLGNSLVIYRKELRDMLRDKRTIRSMVVMPLVAFPLLFLIIGYISATFSGEAKTEIAPVMIRGGDDSPKILAALHHLSGIRVIPCRDDAIEQVSDKKIRAVVDIPPGFDAAIGSGQSKKISIGYFENNDKSEEAESKLEKFFGKYRDQVVRAELAARGLPANLMDPFTVKSKNVAPPSKVGAALFGGWIPYLIIIFSFTGATYPAMDLTAGEKERGTMETILSSPVSRTDIVMGKFLTVVTASVLTAILSLISMGASFAWAKPKLMAAAHATFQMSIEPSTVAVVVVMLLPLAILFASALLAVSLLAKSFREAQTYVGPMSFIVIAPAIIGAFPGVELNWKTALVPILNTSLVSKEIIGGSYPWLYIAAIFGMTCLYAGIAITWAVRMFNREDVLFRT
ncbi:MAG TPA: ABC transporter permease [Candidatus Acidoferrales bacterium]|nr:ABC transporter permease [Candidatus Acidoferrales bacterium]